VRRSLAQVAGAIALTVVTALPAAAHDGDHTEPGASGPDTHSRNVKLLANVPKSNATTQSDLAFWGDYTIAANYGGFRIIDTADPEHPHVVTDFRCNGGQGDVSVYGDYVFQSIDSPQSKPGCDSTNATASTPGMFEGIRVIDISRPTEPRLVATLRTDCGSHTHTLLPEPENGRVVLYVSSYPLGGAALGPNCVRGHGFVSIVDLPLAEPGKATVTKYHFDAATETASYFGGAFEFKACHDVSVFKELELAAAACMSEAQLWDISDPLNPRLKWRFDDPVVNTANIDLWHSASFSWDGEVVAFGDESGGGGDERCTDPDDAQGRIWFVDTATGQKLANYKIPRIEQGVCTMHNFNFLPLRDGRKVLVASAYTGGTSIVDVDRLLAGAGAREAEIGFYRPSGSNTWSSYWYNGHVYGNDILRGLDIFLLSDRARAGALKLDHLNPQTQLKTIG
jgi:hypothetical protein